MPGQRAKETEVESAGSRVTLRPLTEDDVHAVADWYEGAQDLQRRLREARADPLSGLLAVTMLGRATAIGVLGYRAGYPEDGWLGFNFVAVEPGLRGLGLDSEAVRLLEEEVSARGLARRFWASVDHGDGLALYFWLRLGYRPARPDDVSWKGDPGRDIMAMVRI